MFRRILVSLLLVLISVVAFNTHDVASTDKKRAPASDLGPSPMGLIARGDEPIPVVEPGALIASAPVRAVLNAGGNDRLTHSPTAADFQAETTIAKNGDWIVVGYNDIRGFAYADPRVSGVAYSHDNGVTWTDGGQLPNAGLGDDVFGDPDVKTWTDGVGTRYFAYSSLYALGDGRRTLCVHISTDGGVSWSPPRQVTSATTPSDFPDKEYIDFDPETGRLFISWTNFGATTTMRVSYSTDRGLTWSPATVFASSGQGSVPRAAGNSSNVYMAWTTGGNIMFSRSINNGLGWSAPVSIAAGRVTPMNPYGSDRIHGFPSMDVDPNSGNIYVVHASRNLPPDFSDIYVQRSTDGGLSFSPVALINASPGNDRAQFFPWVCADETDGSVSVIWYDQRGGTDTSDLTELVHTHSLDGGVTWSCPGALSDQPFHAEAGNTTSQPNIGDYNQCVSVDGTLYSSFAKTDRQSWTTFAPDTYVDVSPGTGAGPAPIVITNHSFTDVGCVPGNGYIEPTEGVALTLELTNVGGCGGVGNISATLVSNTPGVTVTVPSSTFPNLPSLGSTSTNSPPFEFVVDPSVPCGSTIDLTLEYLADSFGEGSLPFQGVLYVGHPVTTVLLSENFDGVVAPALPAGWITATLAGASNPWATSVIFAASGPNSVFCADIAVTSHNELRTPALPIPAGTEIVRVDVDETHNMEVNVERQAWDGGLMRILTGGTRRLSGAMSNMSPFYPWQILRGSSATQPLQDLACWSDDTTPNFAHYTFDMPDLGGETVSLLFSVGTDPAVGTATGQFIDNVVVTAIDYECDCNPTATGPTPLAFDRVDIVPNPFNPETAIRFSLASRTTVTAAIYSVDGKRVRTLSQDRATGPGAVEMRWNGLDDRGTAVASGIYFVRVSTPLGEHIARAVLLK
jgi:hypothetical protein